MIEDQQHDLAIAYVFGYLQGEARKEFEAWLDSHVELRKLIDDLRETAAALALAAPQHLPPPTARARTLAIPGGGMSALDERPSIARNRTNWMPWAVSGALAVVAVMLQLDRIHLAREADQLRTGIDEARLAKSVQYDRPTPETAKLQLLEAQTQTHLHQIAELRDEVVKLRSRDSLSHLRIVSLRPQLEEFSGARAIVVWDAEQQRGLLNLAGLPQLASPKGYELWVFVRNQNMPVSCGIFDGAKSPTAYAFKPSEFVAEAQGFKVSLSPPDDRNPVILTEE
jgi:anti-sigma-K factor RskA